MLFDLSFILNCLVLLPTHPCKLHNLVFVTLLNNNLETDFAAAFSNPLTGVQTCKAPSSLYKLYRSIGEAQFCCRQQPFRTPLQQRRAQQQAFLSCKAALAEPPQRPSSSASATSSTTAVAPQTEARPLQPPALADQPPQLYMRGRKLLGGREVEEVALKQCVELHERWQRGERGPTLDKRWQGISSAHAECLLPCVFKADSAAA